MLWEALDADCMDVAVKLHGAAVRLLLTRHGGYESATEGDAFILAFSAAHDALSFSLDLQAELLELAWPQQLLAQTLCAEVYMTQWWVRLPDSTPCMFTLDKRPEIHTSSLGLVVVSVCFLAGTD